MHATGQCALETYPLSFSDSTLDTERLYGNLFAADESGGFQPNQKRPYAFDSQMVIVGTRCGSPDSVRRGRYNKVRGYAAEDRIQRPGFFDGQSFLWTELNGAHSNHPEITKGYLAARKLATAYLLFSLGFMFEDGQLAIVDRWGPGPDAFRTIFDLFGVSPNGGTLRCETRADERYGIVNNADTLAYGLLRGIGHIDDKKRRFVETPPELLIEGIRLIY